MPTEGDINHIAYNLYYSQQIDRAIQVIEWALEMYPDDVNLYDSMGEFQQSNKNNEQAKAFYQKGLAVIDRQKSQLDSAAYTSLKSGFEKRLQKLAGQ